MVEFFGAGQGDSPCARVLCVVSVQFNAGIFSLDAFFKHRRDAARKQFFKIAGVSRIGKLDGLDVFIAILQHHRHF